MTKRSGSNRAPGLSAKQPKNAFTRSLTFAPKDLFKALAKGIGHTAIGKWEELGSDAVEALSAIGMTTEPDELVFLLLRRSLTLALFELMADGVAQQIPELKQDATSLVESMAIPDVENIRIDKRFLESPADIALLTAIKPPLMRWLHGIGLSDASAAAVAERLPSYFVYALNREWRRNSKAYAPIIEALSTPFTRATEREWAWEAYGALLRRRVDESVFDEPFSLRQIYVPLRAYYTEDADAKPLRDDEHVPRKRRVVLDLASELTAWMNSGGAQDALRVISGGPGSGKSSFARIFAAEVSQKRRPRILFVPLHLIDPTRDLVDEIGRFTRDEGILPHNPLDPASPDENVLVIFDGLDELASQGKAAAETARAFIREIDRTIEKRNSSATRLRALISGRELVVQENESEFRRPKQIMTLLPYVSKESYESHGVRLLRVEEEFVDPSNLLRIDLRDEWWRKYGLLTGKHYVGLPVELARDDLDEVTAQPLLNYLIALSYSRERLNFRKGLNLNAVYEDLVTAVHERAYEKKRPYTPIRHMSLSNFMRVLEEVGLAAWHGDGRTTTVSEIEQHCEASGVGSLLEAFSEGARAGVTRLLAAFFFRQHGRRATGDPTFVFTHKSFGEYLAARRLARAMDKLFREVSRRHDNPDEGWHERDALVHWMQICGPSPISPYLHSFLLDELRLRVADDYPQRQDCFGSLFSFALRHSLPAEMLNLPNFRISLFHVRNSEEALLVALNAIARLSGRISEIEHPDPAAFGAWFKRIQGQRTSGESVLAARCLSYLNLRNALLHISDFYGANFSGSDLRRVQAAFACFHQADFTGANLEEAALESCNCERARFAGANLTNSQLRRSNFEGADFAGAQLGGAAILHAHFDDAVRKAGVLRDAIEDDKYRRTTRRHSQA